MQEKICILDKIEELRNRENGKPAFYIMLGVLIGIIIGVIIAPKFVGSFNGAWSGNSASGTK